MPEGIQDRIASVAASRLINVIQSCTSVGNKVKKKCLKFPSIWVLVVLRGFVMKAPEGRVEEDAMNST